MIEIAGNPTFNSIENYIIRRIQLLEGQVEKLTKELERTEEERDVYKAEVEFFAGQYELKRSHDDNEPFFMATSIYKKWEPNEFQMLCDIKAVDPEGET